MIFFYQAEDGIRDIGVTGVQTCALPIYGGDGRAAEACAAGVVHRSSVRPQNALVSLRVGVLAASHPRRGTGADAPQEGPGATKETTMAPAAAETAALDAGRRHRRRGDRRPRGGVRKSVG